MKVVVVDTGTKFRKDGYTMKLFRALVRNSTRPWSFEVITESKFPAWWGKLEMFPAKERTVYLDLDTIICGNVDFLFDYDGDFCIRRNPWPGRAWCDSSLFSLAPGYGKEIAKRFFDDPKKIMDHYRSDQEFLGDMIAQDKADIWQEIAPRKTQSYKANALEHGPDGAAIVAFHGIPKPHELPPDHWARRYWL